MKTAFDHAKLMLTAKPVQGGSFPPSLKADMFNTNPSIFVLTGIKKGDGPTFVRAGLEIKTAGLICSIIEKLADVPKGNEVISASIDCKSGKDRELVARVVVGKETNGRMFIAVQDVKNSNAPVIQFFFGTDLYHPVSFKNFQGDEFETISCLAAKEWAKRARMWWYTVSIDNPPPENNNNGGNNRGGNGGGWNNNNNSNNNNSGAGSEWDAAESQW